MDAISLEDLGELRDKYIGLTLTAIVAGVRNRERINTWCEGLLAPNPEEARRLTFALKVLREVAGAESPDTARSWFIGGNVGDECISPAEAIRMNRFDEVQASAQRLVDDVPFSA